MTTEKVALTQLQDISSAAGISPGGRRPEGEIPAAAPIAAGKLPETQVKADQKSPRRKFSTAYKLQILERFEACDNALARGALLRKEGLYSSRLSTWRKQRDEGTLGLKTKKKTPESVLLNQQLARENEQLKKRLAEAGAIIDLQKKVSELLGMHILSAQNSEEKSWLK